MHHTHDPSDASPTIADRCAALHAMACTYDGHGMLTGVTAQPSEAQAWARSATVQSLVRQSLVRRLAAGADAGDAVPIELFRGCWLTLLPHGNALGARAWTAAIALGPDALGERAFEDACRDAGMSAGSAAEALRPFVRHDRDGATLLAKCLTLAAADLAVMDEQRAALAGFTEQLSDSYDTIDLLYTVGRSMRAPFEPERFLHSVTARLHGTMNFAWVAVRFSDAASVAPGLRGRLAFAGTLPVGEEAFRAASLPLITGKAHGPIVVTGGTALAAGAGAQVLCQPVLCKGGPIGVVLAGGKGGADPMISSYDLQLVEGAAGYVNAFADNVALYDDQHALFLGTLQALTASIDAKDRYTCGHSERVAHLSTALALASGLSAADAERIRIAGLVHDVGKIGVPEAVLTKPGKLTDEEFAAIRRHPEIGYRILKDIPLLADVLPGVLHHHERRDGRGYPAGLRDDEIPLQARIIAVADTFDAMSSNRSYRKAMAREAVLAEIDRSAGPQLDAAVAACLRTIDFSAYDAMVARHAAEHLGLAA